MKLLLAAAITFALGMPSVAAEPSLEGMGHPFAARTAVIDWQLATNALPTLLTVHAALPSTFTAEVLSNLVALAEFKDSDGARLALRPARQGKRVVFEELESRKSLIISPRTGYVDYFNALAEALPGTPVQGVPSEGEALDRALSILAKLGLKESDVSHDPDTHQLEFSKILGEIGQFDKQTQKVRKTPVTRGVILFRQLKSISLSGPGDCGGVRVEFANNAKVKELAISWRTLKPHHAAEVVGPNQLIQRIRDGEAVISPPPGAPDPRLIKKLTVQKIRIYYLGAAGNEPQRYVYPYAALRAVADFGSTNLLVTLNCSVLK